MEIDLLRLDFDNLCLENSYTEEQTCDDAIKLIDLLRNCNESTRDENVDSSKLNLTEMYFSSLENQILENTMTLDKTTAPDLSKITLADLYFNEPKTNRISYQQTCPIIYRSKKPIKASSFCKVLCSRVKPIKCDIPKTLLELLFWIDYETKKKKKFLCSKTLLKLQIQSIRV
jgi:hypothetical protein